METRASYLIVGSFMIALLAGLFLFVIWLAHVQVSQQFTPYLIYFKGSVTGLQSGSTVRYRGIPVGSVTKVRIDPNDVEQVEATIEVNSDTPIKTDTEASLEVQGLTGVAYVQLSGGTQGAPPLQPAPGKKIAVIPSRPSQLERLFSSAPELLDRVNVLVARATLFFDQRNIQNLADTLENIRTLTAAFAARGEKIAALIDNASTAMQEVQSAAAAMNTLSRSVKPEDVSATVTQLRQATASINRLANELETVVSENRRPLRDFSAEGLYELTQFLTEARTMVASVTRLTNRIEADPARFFFGNQQEGVPAR
ncbi:MAG TPA: MlaD family protein [Alphaproteobacteria bacterium]|nr:MlaD family protein [Alphaproteobacteria bacterium]